KRNTVAASDIDDERSGRDGVASERGAWPSRVLQQAPVVDGDARELQGRIRGPVPEGVRVQLVMVALEDGSVVERVVATTSADRAGAYHASYSWPADCVQSADCRLV